MDLILISFVPSFKFIFDLNDENFLLNIQKFGAVLLQALVHYLGYFFVVYHPDHVVVRLYQDVVKVVDVCARFDGIYQDLGVRQVLLVILIVQLLIYLLVYHRWEVVLHRPLLLILAGVLNVILIFLLQVHQLLPRVDVLIVRDLDILIENLI